MRIAAQKINNRGVEVSRMRVRQTTEKYVKQSGQMCEKLYDMGFISNPSYFDEEEFFGCFFDEYPELMPLFRNVTTGSVNLSGKQVSYVIKVIGVEHKAYEVLGAANSAAQASQALSDITSFMEKVRFQKKSDTLLCRSSLAVSNRVYSSGKLSLDGPYLRECFYVPAGKHIEAYNYSLELLRTVLHNIGVDTPVSWGDKSVFLGDGFTVADDCEFMLQLIRGDIEGSGELAKKLHEAVESYYTEYYSNRTTIAECIKYEEQAFLDAIPNSIACINAFRREHPDYDEFFVDSQCVYFLAPGSEKSAAPTERDIFIGEDIAAIGSTQVPLINRLLGYSGWFLYKFDNSVMDYDIVGMPITMYVVSNGERVPVEYYPASSLRKRCKTMSIPVVAGGSYSREIFTVEEICANLEVDSLDTLDAEVAELVDVQYKTHANGFKSLVGLLVQSLVCVMCDYTPVGRKSPNHVHLDTAYGWVTDEIYLDACAVAETFYSKLGF